MLVAAGGHFCPLPRLLSIARPDRETMVVAQEYEIELSAAQQARSIVDPQTPEIYFCRDLLGYGWCIRKMAWLNVGLGREHRRDLPGHVAVLFFPPPARANTQRRARRLSGTRLSVISPFDAPAGVADGRRRAFGSAMRPGIADTRSGEGIGPAIESAVFAARAIIEAGGDYRPERLELYRRLMEARFGPRCDRSSDNVAPSAFRQWLGRKLLGRRWFIRRAVLDDWFLHRRAVAREES